MNPERREDFELTLENADTIIDILTPSDTRNWDWHGTPSDVCKTLNIDRRTFNSILSKAIFSRNPTKAQQKIRHFLMMSLVTVCYHHNDTPYKGV